MIEKERINYNSQEKKWIEMIINQCNNKMSCVNEFILNLPFNHNDYKILDADQMIELYNNLYYEINDSCMDYLYESIPTAYKRISELFARGKVEAGIDETPAGEMFAIIYRVIYSEKPRDIIIRYLNEYQMDLINKELCAMGYCSEFDYLNPISAAEIDKNEKKKNEEIADDMSDEELKVLAANALYEYLYEKVRNNNEKKFYRKGFK